MPDSMTTPTDRDLVEQAIALIAERLPGGWDLQRLTDAQAAGPHAGPDAVLDITNDGEHSTVVVEVKRTLGRRDVSSVREQLSRYLQHSPFSEMTTAIVVSRYLAPPVRERLADAGVSYVDATGNMRIQVSSPGLFIADRGADSDPWRGPGRPRADLRGPVPAKIVRTLLDFDRAWKVTDLISESLASSGSVYRVLEFLEDEDLVVRTPDGRIRLPDWDRLLRLWSRDYSFTESNKISRWLAPRGLERLQTVLAKTGKDNLPYAVTGSLAAHDWAPYAPVAAALIYVNSPEEAADAWGLRPADTGANVLLAEPHSFVFARTVASREWGGRLAAPAQVAADLLTGPGRNPSEGEELISWMKDNEPSWRLP
jgi:hypothetical protein